MLKLTICRKYVSPAQYEENGFKSIAHQLSLKIVDTYLKLYPMFVHNTNLSPALATCTLNG